MSQEYLVPDTMFWQGCGTWSQGTGVRYQISDLRGIPGETAAEGETTSLMCNHLPHICHKKTHRMQHRGAKSEWAGGWDDINCYLCY